MKTFNISNSLRFTASKIYTENKETFKINVTISLDDECHNNICDWSITADIYRKNKASRWIYCGGGCCHEEILKQFPEFDKFVRLHLSNYLGQPTYAVENGAYIMKQKGINAAAEYLRISADEAGQLYKAVDDKEYFKYLLFSCGIVDKWAKESAAAIAELERLCGKKWENPYKPEEERFILRLPDEERTEIENRIKSGYYSEESVNLRKDNATKAEIAKRIEDIETDFNKAVSKAEAEKNVKIYILKSGIMTTNFIYYNHTNKVVFNWLDYDDKISQEQFVDFINNIDYSQLPEGIQFEIK